MPPLLLRVVRPGREDIGHSVAFAHSTVAVLSQFDERGIDGTHAIESLFVTRLA